MALTRIQLINRAIEIALLGTDANTAPANFQEGFVESLAIDTVQDFAIQIARDPEQHFLLQKTYAVSLSAGVGTLPVSLLPETLRAGRVSDADENQLERVEYLSDLAAQRSPLFGYYCVVNDQIFTRQISSGSLVDTNGPLVVVAGFIPDIDTLSADVPAVIQSDLVDLLATRVRLAMTGGAA